MSEIKWQIINYYQVKALIEMKCLICPPDNTRIFRISASASVYDVASIRAIETLDTRAWAHACKYQNDNRFLLISPWTYEELYEHYAELNGVRKDKES